MGLPTDTQTRCHGCEYYNDGYCRLWKDNVKEQDFVFIGEERSLSLIMKMMIDDHIEVLKSYNNGFTGYAGNLQNSINVAIDTMRKYQKIQEIINNAKDSDGAIRFNWLYEQIKEEVEDGNDC